MMNLRLGSQGQVRAAQPPSGRSMPGTHHHVTCLLGAPNAATSSTSLTSAAIPTSKHPHCRGCYCAATAAISGSQSMPSLISGSRIGSGCIAASTTSRRCASGSRSSAFATELQPPPMEVGFCCSLQGRRSSRSSRSSRRTGAMLPAGRGAALVAAAASAEAGGPGVAAGAATASTAVAPRVEEPSTALLLAWFACGNRSLFAAQCLVEVVVELYREGRSFEELQLSLKVATQGGRPIRRGGPPAVGASGDPREEEGQEGEQVVTAPLLQGQDEDVLVSWVALVFLTLEELGVPRDSEQQQGQAASPGRLQGGGPGGGGGDSSSSSMAAGSPYLRGMLGYVRQTLGMYDEGQTLARVAGLQGLVQQSSGSSPSPFLLLMQQYTRLVLLTVEVVAAAGLPTNRPLRPPETVLRPSGYSGAFTSCCNAAGAALDEAAAVVPEPCPARGLAVRLLMAFMGAVLGSPWSLGRFVEAVRVAYDQGLAADELFSQLDEQEFVQSGGLLPLASPSSSAAATATGNDPAPSSSMPSRPSPATGASDSTAASSSASSSGGGGLGDLVPPPPPPAPQHQITKALLSTWISLSYMTMAQLAVPYPAAGQRLGWAWAGFGDPIEALGMNDFVGNVLRQMAGEDPRAVSPPPPQTTEAAGSTEEAAPAEPAAAAAPGLESNAGGLAAAGSSDGFGSGSAGEGLDMAAVGPGARSRSPGRRRSPSEVAMVRVQDESLATTSTAFRVLSQQVALVQAVCRDVFSLA